MRIAKISLSAMVLSAVVFASASFASAAGLTVNNNTLINGQNLQVSGACGSAAANGQATVTLGNQSLSPITLDAQGNLSSGITVPSTFANVGSGANQTQLTVTCPNGGTVLSAPISVFASDTERNASLTVNNNNLINGQTLNISGLCGTTSANGQASVTLGSGNLSLGNIALNGQGNLNSTITIPTGFVSSGTGANAVTLRVTCPNGTVLSTPITVFASDFERNNPNTVYSSIFRMYNFSARDHFFTTSYNEMLAAQNLGYRLEGITGSVTDIQATGSSPFYRLYNSSTHHHAYATTTAARDQMIASGFQVEGMLGYLYQSSSYDEALWQMHNSSNGDYFYTTDMGELAAAANFGYASQGSIANFVLKLAR
jgi:hypothetical protein